jgi:hypothetical protein
MEFLRSLNEAKLHSRMHFEGLDISVEVPAGGSRRGVNKKTGDEWAMKVTAHYGYIKGTHSPDGEHLDCYLRRNPKKNALVYVVHQMTVDGSKFDEDKVMLGYGSQTEAVRAFKSMTFKPSQMFGGVTEFDMEHFQLACFSASNSHAMLTNNKTYLDFKKRGLLGKNIKSPNMIARRVCEGLSEGLEEIGQEVIRDDLAECLDRVVEDDLDLNRTLARAYHFYTGMDISGPRLSESQFKSNLTTRIMELDAIGSDGLGDQLVEDQDLVLESIQPTSQFYQELSEDLDELEESDMSNESYVVVIHTQIMENVGTTDQPSWGTHGGGVHQIGESHPSYGEARAAAARVASGETPVEIKEGAYVLGIDVMPLVEYRQLHESDNEEVEVLPEADLDQTTEDVFFAQQVQETARLAGVHKGVVESSGTPSVHETRARLEALTQSFYEGLEEEAAQAVPVVALSEAQLLQAANLLEATLVLNPKATRFRAAEAVCERLFKDANRADEVLQAWEAR